MIIDEAIKRLEVFKKDTSEGAPELLDDAIQLGIEALRREKQRRENPRWGLPPLLPGETEE
jgi:hypothetical protein